MPDLEIIGKHLQSYIGDLKNLEKYSKVTIDEIKGNKDLLWILERGLYLLLQNLLDMLAHIVSSDFNERWDFYTDLGEILEQKKIITSDDKILLDKMVGFRNRLSHEYLSLELNVLTDVVNNRLIDFHKFLMIIKNYCKL
ncbi:MAG: HepT-like ribonuclease domain-containing protein [Melioribacteraceae bacterium]